MNGQRHRKLFVVVVCQESIGTMVSCYEAPARALSLREAGSYISSRVADCVPGDFHAVGDAEDPRQLLRSPSGTVLR